MRGIYKLKSGQKLELGKNPSEQEAGEHE